MTRDEAVALIRKRMSRFTTNAVLDGYIVDEMKAYQQKLEEKPFLPWFLLEESSSISMTIGEERVPLPSDFLKEEEGDALWLEDAQGTEYRLEKNDYDYMRKRYTANARPVNYAIIGPYFRLRPKPDIAYTLRMIYFKNDAVLTTNIENQWLKYASDLMIAGTGVVIASQYTKDMKSAQMFMEQEAEAYRDLISTDQARKDANRTYQAED